VVKFVRKILFNNRRKPMKRVPATVVFLLDQEKNRLYMGRKTKGVGEGKFTGPGGIVDTTEQNVSLETPPECASRKTMREARVIVMPSWLEKIGVIDFFNHPIEKEPFVMEVHFFFARRWIGDPIDTVEMVDGRWFSLSDLIHRPQEVVDMLAADYLFLPHILSGRKIKGKCVYALGSRDKVAHWGYLEVDHFDP
jgi:ADP-ribose pyrophosphatase YjhB (NUDIX family)